MIDYFGVEVRRLGPRLRGDDKKGIVLGVVSSITIPDIIKTN